MHYRGMFLRAAIAAVILVALAGCSAASGGSAAPSGGTAIGQQALGGTTPTQAPHAAQCWQLTYLQFLQEPEGPSGTQVSCTTAHQAITFATLTPDLGDQRASAAAPANLACSNDYNLIFPNSIEAYRLLVAATLPSAADWTQGERSVRCQVQEFAIGSPFLDPNFVDLPTTIDPIETAYAKTPSVFHLCVNEPGTSGVTGPSIGDGAVIADCATAQWRLRPSPDFPDPAGEPYPGYNGLYPFMHSHCGALYDTAAIRGWIFYPSADQWAQSDRDFECWTGSR